MASPSNAITRLDLSLTYQEFSLAANQQKFIGLQVLPPIAVSQEGAEFVRISISSLLTKVEETKRSPKSGYARDDWEWTKDSYAVDEHGIPILQGSIATLQCSLFKSLDGGDHSIFIGLVDHVIVRDAGPLIYFRGGYSSLQQNQ